MKNFLPFLFLLPLLFTACSKEENLPATEYVMVKFQNKSGEDIQGLIVSRADVGDLMVNAAGVTIARSSGLSRRELILWCYFFY